MADTKESGLLVFIKYILPVLMTVAGIYFTLKTTIPPTVNTAQTVFSERKIDAYLELTRRLALGRNPRGDISTSDTLVVHRNDKVFELWWRNVDDYFYENEVLFDDTTKLLYHDLNVLTLEHRRIFRESSPVSDSLKHELKEPLSKKIRTLNEWMSAHLREKYGIDEGLSKTRKLLDRIKQVL